MRIYNGVKKGCRVVGLIFDSINVGIRFLINELAATNDCGKYISNIHCGRG